MSIRHEQATSVSTQEITQADLNALILILGFPRFAPALKRHVHQTRVEILLEPALDAFGALTQRVASVFPLFSLGAFLFSLGVVFGSLMLKTDPICRPTWQISFPADLRMRAP